MKEVDIQTVAKKKYKAPTDPNHIEPVAENYLNHNFIPGKPNKTWIVAIMNFFSHLPQDYRLGAMWETDQILNNSST